MSYRIFTILIIGLLFLSGCATNSSYQVGGYQNNLHSDLKIFGQYEIQHIVIIDRQKRVFSKPFDSNGKYLPDRIIKLHLGLMVDNPNREKFEIWIEAKFTELNTGDLFQLTKYVYKSQMLPKEFISIDLPRNVKPNSEVEFWAKAISIDGNVLYKSSMVKYKIGKHTK
jgi:hypothetical protein